jgi:hypothetical protein
MNLSHRRTNDTWPVEVLRTATAYITWGMWLLCRVEVQQKKDVLHGVAVQQHVFLAVLFCHQ